MALDENTPMVIPSETDEQRDIRMNKDIAAFSYVWIMSVIVYVARKDSHFIQYHSKQGIVLFLLTIPAAMIPIVGKLLLFILVVGMMVGFVHAAHGKYEDVPIVGDLAKGKLTVKDIVHSVAAALESLAKLLKRTFRKPESSSKPSENPEIISASPVDTPPTTPVL